MIAFYTSNLMPNIANVLNSARKKKEVRLKNSDAPRLESNQTTNKLGV